MALSTYSLKGAYNWNIEEILTESQIYPVPLGRYVCHFKFEKHRVSEKVLNVKISARLECAKNPILIQKDRTRLTLRFKLNKEKHRDNKLCAWEVREFDHFILIFNKDIFDSHRAQNDDFNMEWDLGKMRGSKHQQCELEINDLQKREQLLQYISKYGDVKMYYEVADAAGSKRARKKMKMNNNAVVLPIGEEETKTNYLLMDSGMLKNESDYFRTYLGQKHTFEDSVESGYIYFGGDKEALSHLIEYIVVGRINKDINALSMVEIAGTYGVRRFQLALVRNIVDQMTYDRYVGTMKTLIRNDVIDSVFDEVIGYGALHFRRLSKRGDWSRLGPTIINSIKLQIKNKKIRKYCK